MQRLLPILLAAVFAAGACQEAPGERESEGGGPTASLPSPKRPRFDGQAAHLLVRTQVEFGPRVPGRPGHERQLAWMIETLRPLADTLRVESFTFVTRGGVRLELTNLMAGFRPDAEHRILLLSHWDTRPISDQSSRPEDRELPVPGANDGASGTAILLQLARMMARDPPPGGVDLLFLDGEDYGPGTEDMFIGSRHFARGIPQPSPWRYGVLLDMVGDLDPNFPVEAYSAERAPSVVQRIWGIARELGYGGFFPMRVGPRVVDDHLPLNDAGLPTVDVIDFEYGPGNRLWHTPQDVPQNTSAQTLGMVGEVLAELVYRGG